MARYAIIENGAVANIAVAVEPLADNWLAIEGDVQAGDTFDGQTYTRPEPVVIVPDAVTPRQAKLALLGADKLDAVDTALAAIPDATQRKAAQIEWDSAIEFRRAAPLIATLGGAIGLTEAQIDALFVQAATL